MLALCDVTRANGYAVILPCIFPPESPFCHQLVPQPPLARLSHANKGCVASRAELLPVHAASNVLTGYTQKGCLVDRACCWPHVILGPQPCSSAPTTSSIGKQTHHLLMMVMAPLQKHPLWSHSGSASAASCSRLHSHCARYACLRRHRVDVCVCVCMCVYVCVCGGWCVFDSHNTLFKPLVLDAYACVISVCLSLPPSLPLSLSLSLSLCVCVCVQHALWSPTARLAYPVLSQGDILVYSSALLHRGAANTTDQPRPILVYRSVFTRYHCARTSFYQTYMWCATLKEAHTT